MNKLKLSKKIARFSLMIRLMAHFWPNRRFLTFNTQSSRFGESAANLILTLYLIILNDFSRCCLISLEIRSIVHRRSPVDVLLASQCTVCYATVNPINAF